MVEGTLCCDVEGVGRKKSCWWDDSVFAVLFLTLSIHFVSNLSA